MSPLVMFCLFGELKEALSAYMCYMTYITTKRKLAGHATYYCMFKNSYNVNYNIRKPNTVVIKWNITQSVSYINIDQQLI
jgi:hypothetical protein